MPSSRWPTQMNPIVFLQSFASRFSFEHHFLSDLLLVYYGFWFCVLCFLFKFVSWDFYFLFNFASQFVCVLKKEWKKSRGVGWVGSRGGSEKRWRKRNHCQNKWYEKIVFKTKHILKTLCSFLHVHHWGCTLEEVLYFHGQWETFYPTQGSAPQHSCWPQALQVILRWPSDPVSLVLSGEIKPEDLVMFTGSYTNTHNLLGSLLWCTGCAQTENPSNVKLLIK